MSVFLSVLVAVLGASLLHTGFYRDVMAFLLCFTIAGCQYSLLKSVQPDAASPTHGHNRLVAFRFVISKFHMKQKFNLFCCFDLQYASLFSRPAYFCLLSSLILILERQIGSGSKDHSMHIYGFSVHIHHLLIMLRETLATVLVSFPVAFSLGLFPQVNTFSMYLLEQVILPYYYLLCF